MAEAHVLGKNAEKAAQEYLQNIGYQIVEINWRVFHLEVDIIARDGDFLVIVEVKARATEEYGHPSEFISKRKEVNLIEAADYYIEHKALSLEVRFDVITALPRGEGFLLEHFKDAFTPYS